MTTGSTSKRSLKILRKTIEAQWIRCKRELYRRYTIMTKPQLRGLEAAGGGSAITITRIVGNDLHPRHADGQSTKNLQFLLENEPDFPNCRKVFVINRLFDGQREAEAAEMVRSHGHIALVLPFVEEDYAQKLCDLSAFGGMPYPQDEKLSPPLKGRQVQKRLWASAQKICYAMNINGARNVALADGRSNSQWTVLLDGSCFVSTSIYAQLSADLMASPITPYVIIPMVRLQSNDRALTQHPVASKEEEPQIAFHRDSKESFDERLPYGLRDKTSLLGRIGVPGPWSSWHPWNGFPKAQAECHERHHYRYANTCVFRLSSGAQGGQLEAMGAQRLRYSSRNKAIFQSLAMLDKRAARSNAISSTQEQKINPLRAPDQVQADK